VTALLEKPTPSTARRLRIREVDVARGALVVVALAILDDAFVHREPGTSMLDHLAAGIVPAVAAVGLAFLYPRLRPGARAGAALVCGSLAIDYLAAREDVIGGLGLSVGGELLLQAAARDERLAAVVSEGAGRQSLADQLQTPDVPKAIRWLSPMTVETAAGIVLANRMPPDGLVDVMPRIAPRPVLLISGGRGNADEELNPVYRDAGGPSSVHWQIPMAGHTGGLDAAPAEYERRVVGFFDRALLGR
jgi:hypothetical protein